MRIVSVGGCVSIRINGLCVIFICSFSAVGRVIWQLLIGFTCWWLILIGVVG